MVYGALFVVSVIYSLILYCLAQVCRPALEHLGCWLALIWVGYVLVGLRHLIPDGEWDRVAGAFVAALLPMVVAYLVGKFQRQQRLVEYYLRRGKDDHTETVAGTCRQPPDGGHCPGQEDYGDGSEG